MGLKLIVDGAYGTGKTGFAATLAEVGPIGVADSEQRWQHYTVPHPTERPRTQPPAGLLEMLMGPGPFTDLQAKQLREAWTKAYAAAYAHPRQIRDDVAWLPKTANVVWVAQTMDPIQAWNTSRVWALDPGIVGIVKDSESVYWDVLQDLREDDEKKGGLTWAPIKRTSRRMVYTLMKSGKHWILVAHTQDIMNKAMEVIDTRPWVEKKNPHWADICLQFTRQENTAPRATVRREKVAAGKAGALAQGKVLVSPSFKGLLGLCGSLPDLIETPSDTMEQIEARAKAAVSRVAGTAYQPGVDNDPKGGA